MIDVEQIQSNWNKYQSLLSKMSDGGIDNLLETLGQRICEAPAAPNKDHHFSYPGGLVASALNIAAFMVSHNGIGKTESNPAINKKSIIKVALLHDVGRMGDLEQNYYLEQDSDWHIEKLGQLYKINKEIEYMKPIERTLYLLQHFSVSLSKEEYIALLSLSEDSARNSLGNLLSYSRSSIFMNSASKT